MSLKSQFKWLTSLTIISVALMVFWVYRLDRHFQFLTQAEPPEICPGHKGPGQVLKVNGTKTLLFSAYQEHRSGKKEVRVIALVLRSEMVAYRCLFCCQKQLNITKGVSNIQKNHFGFAYGTAHIMCPIPSGCETPSHITVTAGADGAEDNLDSFLEVKNQEGKTDSFPYNFTVCFSAMYEYKNVLQLVQSMELLQLLGVNRVVIYQTSNSPEVQRILDYYTNKGLAEVINWSLSRFLNVSRRWLPEHGPGDLHYFGQIPALNDCVYRYMHQSRYVALHDMDELILPQTVDSWSELLPLLEKKYSPNQCFKFENNVFPYTITLPPPGSQALLLQSSWQNVTGVNILAHLYQEPVKQETRYKSFKIIVNPRVVISPNVHGLVQSLTGCSWVDRNVSRMYHIRVPRKYMVPKQLIYDGRLLKYSSSVSLGVNAALKESGLLPENSKQ